MKVDLLITTFFLAFLTVQNYTFFEVDVLNGLLISLLQMAPIILIIIIYRKANSDSIK